jgi:hypothetical protein
MKTSSLKVQYDLRPAKQVERRMLVDTFQRLAQVGFPIREYQYTGFGALYFVDFILFHKLLGIENLLSVERDVEVEDRVRFNCPFDCIDIAISEARDVIPTLSRELHHILWLDYDFPINKGVLDDLYLSGSQLSKGSILLITVDAEPPLKGSSMSSEEPRATKSYFETEAGKYLGVRKIDDFTPEALPKLNLQILLSALVDGIAGRGLSLLPLFHFLYADGHRMLTIGGVLGDLKERRQIARINFNAAFYLRRNFSSPPYEITIPKLTRKERHFLDSAMPCPSGWQPTEFRIPTEDINVYRQIYRFLPAYAELLL